MKNGVCPKCQSQRVVPDLPMHQESLRVVYCQVKEPADKSKFVQKPGSVRSEPRAWVCGDCGYTEIYSTQFAQLADAYAKGWRDGV